MNTEDRDWMLNDYVDGALDSAQREEFERELVTDPALRAEVSELRLLLNRAATLPASIEPPAALWQGIEERIQQGARTNVVRFQRKHTALWWRMGGYAAAAALAAMTGLGYWAYQRPAETVQVAAPVSAPEAPPDIASARSKADEAYTLARAELLDALAQRREAFSPEMKTVLRDNMAVIDAAINEINVALADDPENPVLLHMLVATRDKELNLLEELVSGPQGL